MPESPARRWPIWATFVLFLSAAACVPLTLQRLHPMPKPWTLPALAEHVRAAHPELHIISANKNGDLSGGFYLTSREMMLGELHALRRLPEYRDRWRGVVLCQRDRDSEGKDEELAAWRQGVLHFDNMLIVGDAELVRKLRESLPR